VRGDRPVRLFIVGFGLDSPNDEADVQEFTRLASATGGQYFPVRRGQELIEFIEDLLEPSQFQVAGPDGKVVVAQTGEAALLPALRMPERFEVRYDTARETVRLKGGEAVRLEVDRSFTRLLSVPASKSAPRFGPLAGEPAAESGRDHANRAVVERPLLSDGDLRLNVWLERDDGCFTSWPDELWVEIAPHAADSSGDASPYIFYDANFKPGEPGPLLECVAREWPAGAQQADVSVWCKYAMTKPLLQTPLDDVADRAPPSQRGFSLGDTGISYRVRRHLPLSDTEPLRVGVVEWHVPGGSDLGALKVELLPPADRVVHRFDAENGVVVHTFYYNPASGVVPSELRFTRREDLHGGALRLAAPITVDVFSQQDTVELSFPVSRSVRTPGRP
jgi:hypothetical protein